nr:curli-like amyloid fiber formation chaperone CsgH [Lutibacter sp. B1]
MFFFLIIKGSLCFSQEDDIKAKIVSRTVDNLIDIKAVAQNMEVTYKEGYTYLLFSIKKGSKGNYSRNSQSGEFSLQPNEEKELSTLKINIQKGEECKVYLFIRKDDSLISKDSTIIYSAERTVEKKYIAESEIEIKGLIIEDVKTKLGKDFYDYLYQKYTTSGLKYPFIINITEKPSIGRGSKVSIDVDDRILFEFMTKPDDEYILEAANQALYYINNYSIQRKLLYKNTKI